MNRMKISVLQKKIIEMSHAIIREWAGPLSVVIISFAVVGALNLFAMRYLGLKVIDALSVVSSLISSVAVVAGGVWAWRRFGWERRADEAMKIKGMLMDYEQQHALSAMQYRKDKDIVEYKVKLMQYYNKMLRSIHVSLLPQKLRKRIFDTLWLTVGNDHGKNLEHLDANWNRFGAKVKKIYKDLDSFARVE